MRMPVQFDDLDPGDYLAVHCRSPVSGDYLSFGWFERFRFVRRWYMSIKGTDGVRHYIRTRFIVQVERITQEIA